MSEINPFIRGVVQEAVNKQAVAQTYDNELNKACRDIKTRGMDITPACLSPGNNPFTYKNPVLLNIYPAAKDQEEHLEKTVQMIESTKVNKQLVYEISGNNTAINCRYYGESDDIAIADSAIQNYHPNCITELVEEDNNNLPEKLYAYDFIPSAAFFTQLVSFRDFIRMPINILLQLFSTLEETGIFQIIFVPLDSEVNTMIKESIDCIWKASQGSQSEKTPPSLQRESEKLEFKAPNQKHYAVCMRIILPKNRIAEVTAFINSYLYGSKPFIVMDNRHYSQRQIRNMLTKRFCYHTGFIVNSHELTGLLNFPYEVFTDKKLKEIFMTAPAGDVPENKETTSDIPVGHWVCGNKKRTVFLPDQRHSPGVHIIGKPRSGKSVGLAWMAIELMRRGITTFVFDPHGDLVELILRLIPEEKINDVVVLDFGLNDYTPQITIRENIDFRNPAKFADDMSENMRDVTTGKEKFWGPRMAFYFAAIYHAYASIPELKFADLIKLISLSKTGYNFRKKIKSKLTNRIVIQMLDDIYAMKNNDVLMPVISRLSHLLLDEKSLRLFTLEENKISIQHILETGKLCLVNLACGIIGKQRSSILSGLVDSLICNNIVARAAVPFNERKQCIMIKDEFYLGPGDIQTAITGLTKYGLSLFLAHQHMSQVEKDTRDVLGTLETRICFRANLEDAEEFSRQSKIPVSAFTDQKGFEFIMITKDKVVKTITPKLVFQKQNFSKKIMEINIKRSYLHHEPVQQKPKQKDLFQDSILTFDQEKKLGYDTI